MNKTKNKIIMIAGILAALFSLTIGGCTSNIYYLNFSVSNYTYTDADKYDKGNAEIDAQTVDNIDLSWLFGTATVNYGETEKITLTETANEELADDFIMRTRVVDGTLYVKYMNSVGIRTIVPQKTLTITLPIDFKAENFKIAVSSADVSSDMNAKTIDFSSSSGDIYYTGAVENVFKAKTSSGDVTAKTNDTSSYDLHTSSGDIHIAGKANTVTANSSSGNIRLEIADCEKAAVHTSSGMVTIKAPVKLSDCEINSSSGNVILLLPENFGATITFSASSGYFSSEIAATASGKKHVLGDGANIINVTTSSGDLRIKKI